MTLLETDLAATVLAQLWQMTLVITVFGGLAVFLRARRPHLSHALWILVFLKCVTPPIVSSPWSIFDRAPQRAGFVDVLMASYIPTFISPLHQLPVSANRAVQQLPQSPRPLERVASRGQANAPAWVPILMLVWLLGGGAFAGLSAVKWSRAHRRLRETALETNRALLAAVGELRQQLSIRRNFRLIVTQEPIGPLVFGVWRPTIVLPQRLLAHRSLDEIRPILAHEMIHARRGDTLFGLLQFAALAVWWFHPLVWWANRQASRTCEQCCDEEVISGLRCTPGAYARVLLSVVELIRRDRWAVGCGMTPAEVTSRRIENLMKSNHRFRRRSPIYCWAILFLVASAVLPGDRTFGLDELELAPGLTTRQQADRALAAKDWSAAARAYRRLVTDNPQDGRSWFFLGYSLHADGELDQAIEAHRRASEFSRLKPVALYNWACALSLQGNTAESLQVLETAIEAGFWSPQPLAEDADLANVATSARFAKLASRAKPPAEREIYRQFDFWIGSWDVIGRQGQKVGTNVVTKDEHGFLLTEKWTSTDGDTGTSINYYDPSQKKWKQTWVSANGTIVNYSGEFVEGQMRLAGQRIFTNGRQGQTRVSFTPLAGNQIRQFIEHSYDEGQTWETYFDGTYVRNDVP